MNSLERKLNQIASYWAPLASTDLFGKRAYSAPVQLFCHWEDRTDMYHDKFGKQVVSQSKVFFAEDIALDGYLLLGVSSETDPTTVAGAYEIMQVARVPNLRNLATLYVAIL